MYDPLDVWQSNKKEAYMARIEGRTCFDCANCEHPDEPYKGQFGWCLMCDDFVYQYNNPADAECGAFE